TPKRLLTSVTATAGISFASASPANSSGRTAPSRSEYALLVRRWIKDAGLRSAIAVPIRCHVSWDQYRVERRACEHTARPIHSSDQIAEIGAVPCPLKGREERLGHRNQEVRRGHEHHQTHASRRILEPHDRHLPLLASM